MSNILLKSTFISLILLICTPAGAADQGLECVIIFHGLARTEKSMSDLAHHLKKHNFHVINTGYSSRSKKIQELSFEAINKATIECEEIGTSKIHFVTHSMGGILVRYYLEFKEIKNLGRVVMLSPPNQGSEAVDKLKDLPFFDWINGPAGQQLGTDKDSLPKKLGPPDFEVGIITGDISINPILSFLIPGEDDGKVSVENAKLEGMKDFLVVHTAHPFIMNDENVLKQVTFFIENGIFDKNLNQAIKE